MEVVRHMSSSSIIDTVDTVIASIRNRRSFSLNQLSPEPIDLGAVNLMLEAANWAPSHGQTEPWRFTIFAGEGRRGLSDAFGTAFQLLNPGAQPGSQAEQAQRNRVWQAPVWVSLGMLPALNERGEPRMPEWEEMISVGVAAHNMQLVASAMGLGAKWTSGEVVRHPHVVEFVGLEPRAKILGFLYIGRPAVDWPEGTRRPLADKVRWVTEAPEIVEDAEV
jgi:nitroreductase